MGRRALIGLGIAALAVAALVLALTNVAGVGDIWADSRASCVGQASASYPGLMKVSAETLGAVADRVVRMDECEEKGVPDPAVVVSIYRWSSGCGPTTRPGLCFHMIREAAQRFLTQAGLVSNDDDQQTFHTTDRAYDFCFHIFTTETENDGRPFASIYVQPAR